MKKYTVKEIMNFMDENGNLYLEELKDIPKGFNPTVGGNLWMSGLTSIPEGFNPTVGGNLWLRGEIDNADIHKLHNGDYVEGQYLFCDNYLSLVKRTKKIGPYTVYLGKIPHHNVVSDGANYAHCDRIRDGIADLLFKAAKDRDVDQYKEYDLDTELTVSEMMAMYRVITGACRQGSEDFVKRIETPKEKYTIREAIQLTKGQYGSEKFAEFFA